jgi:hypothetical protein
MAKNLSVNVAKSALSYRELLSQTDAEIAADQLDSNVEQAAIAFKQGLLSMESKLIIAKSDVSSKESALKAAETAVVSAKRKPASELVQAIIVARTNILQAEENLKASKKSQQNLQEMYDYLVNTQKELFD